MSVDGLNLTEEENADLMKNYEYYFDNKNEAEKRFKSEWKNIYNHVKYLWNNRTYSYYLRVEEAEDLKKNYYYYINHREEAENKFKAIWDAIYSKTLDLDIEDTNREWSFDDLDDLINNYSYYVENPDNAVAHFKRHWRSIYRKSKKLGLMYNPWTYEKLKRLKEKYFYYLNNIEEAEMYFKIPWVKIRAKAAEIGATSMRINKKCGMFLGCHVAERVLSHIFKDVKRMPYGNIGYDFVCNKGFKIDVKSACLNKNNAYSFTIKYNDIADYFLLIGFDNRESLNPQQLWLISGNETLHNNKKMNEHLTLSIGNKSNSLTKYLKYKLDDKLKEAISCCDKLKD